jgi:NADH-quinone oxidoreductase subunit H
MGNSGALGAVRVEGRVVTAMARTFGRMTLAGKIIFTLVPILAILTGGLIVLIVVAGKPIVDFLATNIWLVRFVVAATAVLLMSVPSAFLIIYMEMKVIALMNLRIGPDRVGPYGSLLSVVHGLKVLMKEDFSPTGADRLVFTLAPIAVFMATIMSLLVLPFAPGLVGADINIGLLYLFAVSGLSVVGLLMAGWSSFNKYSLLGGLRSAAQVISYEIPLTLSVVGLLLLAGTMSLNQIVILQGPHLQLITDPVTGFVTSVPKGSGWFTDWFVFRQPLGALIFFIAATAEANRTPFDLTEADSEIVAGFATEYSGMRFGFFFFAEYVNVFVVSGLIVTLFFGGWNAPFPWPWPITLNIDPGSMGLGLLFALLIVPPLLILVLAAPFYVGRSSLPWWQALIIGFVLFNLLVIVAIGGWAFISWDWVAGLAWFLGKSYFFVFTFVWMRGTLPRVRIDQLMGFAWKWLLPASLLNLFVTAAALVVVPALHR